LFPTISILFCITNVASLLNIPTYHFVQGCGNPSISQSYFITTWYLHYLWIWSLTKKLTTLENSTILPIFKIVLWKYFCIILWHWHRASLHSKSKSHVSPLWFYEQYLVCDIPWYLKVSISLIMYKQLKLLIFCESICICKPYLLCVMHHDIWKCIFISSINYSFFIDMNTL
jgi:hypothetical protein